MNTNENKLELFYNEWSNKSDEQIKIDINSAAKKAEIIYPSLTRYLGNHFNTLLDIGCGYGSFAQTISKKLNLKFTLGVDYAQGAIDIASKNFSSDKIQFMRQNSLDSKKLVEEIKEKSKVDVFDGVSLIDLLEHVTHPRELVLELSKISKNFIIKLPIEKSIFDNYIWPYKEWPSSKHSNGHLREFDFNTVHYFIRSLGLTPIFESTYCYDIQEVVPINNPTMPLKRKMILNLLRVFKFTFKQILPKRIYLRLIGGGGYFCIATFDSNHILEN